MKVLIINENRIENLILQQSLDSSYWITDIDSNGIERNLILIESEEDKWKLISNKNVYYIYNNQVIENVYLEYGHFYNIFNKLENKSYTLYCCLNQTKYNYYEINNWLQKGIIIGSNPESLIKYNFLKNEACFIKTMDNRVYIYDNNCTQGIYVNDARINKYKEIKSGDIVFIYGLKFIFLVLNQENVIKYYIGVDEMCSNMVNQNLQAIELPLPVNSEFSDVDSESSFELYDEKEYFHKIPRFVKQIEPLEIKIDDPPSKQDEKPTPAILTVGPMLTMSLVSVMSGATAVMGIVSGETTVVKALPSLIMCGTMLISTLLWPSITRLYEKHRRKVDEKKRQEKYGRYIDKIRKSINEAKIEQSQLLINYYPKLNQILNYIYNHDISLWQRKKEDPDYLNLNLGNGTYEMQINLNYSEERFSMDEDNLRDIALKLGSEPKLLENVPLVFSMTEKYISGIIGEESAISEYMRRLLLQIIAFHSYDDVKIVIFTDEKHEYQWEVFKPLPYLFSDDKTFRFYAANGDEHKELNLYMSKILNSRIEEFEQSSGEMDFKNLGQNYVVITDCFKKIRNLDFIKAITNIKTNLGFSLVILDNMMTHLPDQCGSYINLANNEGEFYDNTDFKEVIKFTPELENDINYGEIVYKMSNIPIEIESEVSGHLPTKLGFLEMFNVGKIEQLNINNRWKMNDPTKSLRAPLGLNSQESLIYLDLHEKNHGPHGLIAGTTGSGKSEFIITYILSMCVNYSPNEVAFILIDYKGGGLAGAFENKKNNVRLPHLAGTITNLDKNEMNRTLVSIQSELQRRQQKFNEARDQLGESTIDIYKYQKFFREGKLTEPMPHLFIVCDEFAELKAQQPDFMDNLISAARIGRSLGVHLILATQKPSGVVNDQIWSNTKFRVCLKVADTSDSNEIIKCPDAASIKNAGRFYLQVGMNEIFVLGQSGYCGAPYVPSEIVKKEVDTSINFIDNLGNIIKTQTKEVPQMVETVEDLGDELSNILKQITYIAKNLGVKADNLWLDSIPNNILLDYVYKKYNIKKNNNVTAILGEYDDPSNQKQGVLDLEFAEDGNSIIYGLSGSSREMFIKTLIYSICSDYSVDQVNFYVFDFGSESLRILSKLPHVGDVVFSSESDKVDKLFKMIDEELIHRKKIFADYNGEYENYCRNSGNTVPKYIVVFNNLESFKESYGAYEELLQVLAREGMRYGIYFVMTTSTQSGLYSRFLNSFPNVFVLDMNSKDDYTNILGKIGNVLPVDTPGRGLFKKEIAYEFQVANICEEDNFVNFIKEKGNELYKKYNKKAKAIPVLPDVITFEMLSDELSGLKSVPIGMEKHSLETCKYNFISNKATLISSIELENCKNILAVLLKSFRNVKDTITVLFDFESVFEDLKANANSYCNKEFDNCVIQIENYFNERIKGTEYNAIFILAGIEKMKNQLSSENLNKITDIIDKNDNCKALFIDSSFNLKKSVFENWYLNLVEASNGIWIGQGVTEQNVIKSSEFSKKYSIKISNDFAWVFKNGQGSLIKIINELKNENSNNDL